MTDDPVRLDALTAGVSLHQRVSGHRFSSDDTVTAWVATQVCPDPARVLDLGCGIGSVLLHLAWSLPAAELVGVEAQAVSFALLARNVDHNGLGHRVRIHHGDLRDPAVQAALGGPFDLVTGTPPYFAPDDALAAQDEQRAYARIEYRGGIEAYTEAAVRLLTDGGWFVVCGDADATHRAERAAADTGLAIHRHDVVLPRAGRPPLFAVWSMRRGAPPPAAGVTERVVVLRDADGGRTADARALRAFSGFAEPG